MKQIVEWSHVHFTKIKPDKTELLLLYPSSLNKEVIIKVVLFEHECIRFSEFVKNVGVWLLDIGKVIILNFLNYEFWTSIYLIWLDHIT